MTVNPSTDSTCLPDLSEHRRERRAVWIWGSVIVGLLGLQVAAGVTVALFATRDPSVSVVPDYYEKSLQWDRELAIRDATKALGWKLSVDIAMADRSQGLRLFSVRVNDASGRPVDLNEGTIRWFHHARAGERHQATLLPIQAGRIQAELPMRRPGLWELEIELTDQNGNRFVDRRTMNLEP